MAGISDDVENLRVNRGDFMNALEEVHPAYGVSEEELQQVVQNGIIYYNDNVKVDNSIKIFSLISNICPHRSSFVLVNCSLNKFALQNVHPWLASCFMDPPDQERPLLERPLRKNRDFLSSN